MVDRAFPSTTSARGEEVQEQGMTLREWYAGLAMQGLLSSSRVLDSDRTAELAFAQADAMLRRSNA
jgi:hypothetical protein